MKYYHVDVFTSEPLKGNGLTVVFPERELSFKQMLNISREFKQFETIFIYPEANGKYPVRIFTVEEELDFAGHPLVGAGAVIHRLFYNDNITKNIKLILGDRTVHLTSSKKEKTHKVVLNQGNPEFLNTVKIEEARNIIESLNLSADDINKDYPIEVVSTGLPYILIPVDSNIERAKVLTNQLEKMISKFGAKFIYLFNPETMECRTWDNSGLVEDVATGSAAGPLCAYLVKNGYKTRDKKILVHQGKFIGRSSIITGWVSENEVFIEGEVALFCNGEINYG